MTATTETIECQACKESAAVVNQSRTRIFRCSVCQEDHWARDFNRETGRCVNCEPEQEDEEPVTTALQFENPNVALGVLHLCPHCRASIAAAAHLGEGLYNCGNCGNLLRR